MPSLSATDGHATQVLAILRSLLLLVFLSALAAAWWSHRRSCLERAEFHNLQAIHDQHESILADNNARRPPPVLTNSGRRPSGTYNPVAKYSACSRGAVVSKWSYIP